MSKPKENITQIAGARGAKMSTRNPGRPHKSEGRNISRVSILKCALRLAKKTPLQDLSIVTVARSMSVTPALIHYYVGGRDWLTSGIMNLFYQELLKKWPEQTGSWQDDLIVAGRVIYDQFSLYGGVAAYVVSNSRFRVFQLTSVGDRDHGVELLERFTGRVRAAGLSWDRTGVYAHLMIEFIINTAHGTSHHIFPGEHKQFLEEKTATLDAEEFPNIFLARHAPFDLDGRIAFDEGCNLFLLGLLSESSNSKAKITRSKADSTR